MARAPQSLHYPNFTFRLSLPLCSFSYTYCIVCMLSRLSVLILKIPSISSCVRLDQRPKQHHFMTCILLLTEKNLKFSFVQYTLRNACWCLLSDLLSSVFLSITSITSTVSPLQFLTFFVCGRHQFSCCEHDLRNTAFHCLKIPLWDNGQVAL